MLETTEKEAISEYKSSRAKLECLVAAAIGLRTELSKVPGDVNQLIIQVDASINRGTVALATDDDGPADDSPLPAEVSALQNSTNDCAADEK